MDETRDIEARDDKPGTVSTPLPGQSDATRRRPDPLPIGILAAGALVGGVVWLGILLGNAAWVIATGDWITYEEVTWPRRQPEEAALIAAAVTVLLGWIAARVSRARLAPSRRR